jgi:cytochrome c5
MRKQDCGLILALGTLLFLALFSPRKILIAQTFVVSEAQLADGAAVYSRLCERCHARGRNGAPRLGDAQEWEKRLQKGIERLTVANGNCTAEAGGPLPEGEDFALATAYMIAASQGKIEGRRRRRRRPELQEGSTVLAPQPRRCKGGGRRVRQLNFARIARRLLGVGVA